MVLIDPKTNTSESNTVKNFSDSPTYEKCIKYLHRTLASRDKSHGIDHAISVHQNCVQIWHNEGGKEEYLCRLAQPNKNQNPLPRGSKDQFKPWFYVSVSALLHDVCDHKYTSDDDAAASRELKDFIIREVCGGDDYAANVILLIIDNVSYSKEKKGLLKKAELPLEILALRDVVSDADKLEALGEVGLQRCIEFTKIRMRGQEVNDEQIFREVARHCDDKLLRLLPEYIRTEGGKKIGRPLHEFIANWRKDWEQREKGVLSS